MDQIESRNADAAQTRSVSIDMPLTFIKGGVEHPPNVRVTFDQFQICWYVNAPFDRARRIEHLSDPSLSGLSLALLKDRARLSTGAAVDVDARITHMVTVRTARGWSDMEQPRQQILERKQINVVRSMSAQYCTCVIRSKVEQLKASLSWSAIGAPRERGWLILPLDIPSARTRVPCSGTRALADELSVRELVAWGTERLDANA